MNEAQRHRRLLDYLESHTFITTNDYVAMLDISLSTARRDITKLAEDGKLKKIRNGAETLRSDTGTHHTPSSFIPYEGDIENVEAKKRIAHAAAQLCDEHDSIIVSGSNSTFLMGQYLAGRDVQVVTNFMPLAHSLITQDHQSIIILGGQYLPERQITISPDEEASDDHKSRFVFFTGTGVTAAGIHTSDLLVYMAEKKLLEYGARLIALVDGTKIGKHGGKLLATTNQLDTLITDEAADGTVLDSLRNQGVNVVVV
ncbi:HTH-type transcriptional regulator UlaR [Vibrio europaeus]|uniref:Transcriptional regulator n=1 Tax=Vibrio europaeus TaxID=300876 RepID=A0A178J5E4_9VIBR|nr:HTH-type transcriptional regulator UlaR [Vibrio europaeus]MDC5705818.1 HTH-type transcriptional regulator UlaR [Vibrio europaeus]MDC5709228.1 HTH-type transcriptional regulator UlaR [Vibrio europaeus]MDC5713627.1 HTH-type transcriptional regulator UlaR [Vibrio europaeus]MDC5720347.1 HTH-type transcriptional regulator UlaR [Vibrio europaeus]MDC5723766.1 HTH-type transcriptional regulator UlaR [Vibrio europaeus]